MTSEDFWMYWRPVRELLGPESGWVASQRIAKAFGLEYKKGGDWLHIELTKEIKAALITLHESDHRETLLRVLEARRDQG
jgi:hypothetical protein